MMATIDLSNTEAAGFQKGGIGCAKFNESQTPLFEVCVEEGPYKEVMPGSGPDIAHIFVGGRGGDELGKWTMEMDGHMKSCGITEYSLDALCLLVDKFFWWRLHRDKQARSRRRESPLPQHVLDIPQCSTRRKEQEGAGRGAAEARLLLPAIHWLVQSYLYLCTHRTSSSLPMSRCSS
jgi:hypothetical protein